MRLRSLSAAAVNAGALFVRPRAAKMIQTINKRQGLLLQICI